MVKYTYSIQNDFPNHEVAPDRLLQDIRASSITIAVDYVNTSDDDCDIWFRAELSSADKSVLDSIVSSHSGEPLPDNAIPVTLSNVAIQDGRLNTLALRPIASKITLVSPNWCDKTTWHVDSVYVEDEVATDSGDHRTYVLSHNNIIDAYHGKICFEDTLLDPAGRSYRVTVKVNGEAKTEQDPHYGTGGDYVINYASGTITFFQPLQVSDVVTASYHYARRGTFIIAPQPGKDLLIGAVEVQFSEDIELRDSFIFQAYGYVDVFAPQLMQPPSNIPSGTKIPIGNPLIYKTILDFVSDANGAYPGYPAFGGTNWRALKKQTFIFVWDYIVGVTRLKSAYGMEIHVDLAHDEPCGGSYATATFYCTSEVQ